MPAERMDLAPLLEHAAWVQRLARGLVADPQAADDLAQETWLATLRAPAHELRSPRGFLAAVVRNRFRQQARSAARRRRREELVQEEAVAPPAAVAFERAQLGRELVRLLLELEEPLRSALLLRFFEDLSVREVAERLGLHVDAAESRIGRGLTLLRERWRRSRGGVAADELAALALLAPPAAPQPAATWLSPTDLSLGILTMNAKLVLAGLAVLGGGGLFWMWRAGVADPTHTGTPPSIAAAQEPRAPSGPGPSALAEGAPSGPGERAAIDLPAAPPQGDPAPAAEASELRSISGRVLDPEARPLAGIAVRFVRLDGGGRGEPPRATSHGDGSFSLEVPRVDGLVEVVDPELATLSGASVFAASGVELLLVVAPHRPLAGRVVDESGAPLATARVRLEPPADFETRFEAVLDAASFKSFGGVTDADGRFALERAPIVRDAQVVAALEGYAPAALAAPPLEERALELVLQRPSGPGSIAGRVVDEARHAVPGALVSFGNRTTRAGSQGEFVLQRQEDDAAGEIVALAAGHLPGRWIAERSAEADAPLFPDWVELVLGPAPLSLSGVVLDAEDRPLPGLYVWIDDPTPFGILENDMQGHAEYLLASPGTAGGDYSEAYFRMTDTDAAGRFRLEGLLPREYTLRFMDKDSLARTTAGPFAAGSADLSITFAAVERWTLAGRVVSSTGAPLAGVRVDVLGPAWGGVSLNGPSVTSDAEGRFLVEGLGAQDPLLWLRGDDIVPFMHRLSGIPSEELELVLAVRCHLKLDLSHDPELADALVILDEHGERLGLFEVAPSGVTEHSSAVIVAGRSVTLGVSDAARTLVLEKDGVEVRRMDLSLTPGRLNVITP